ncbi:ImmA/IrrE family metallo-endopeptidase [Allomesorhizobium alhagi]|uniref:IrrE N-terminal-like domain-containing protein n=1 Tax=Mesorhizobium alhagi CCNWXJ12-2 TaxID=1107882 RepID=H0HX49_9HYPH|nr:hypothetical protein MAXJ12_23842 [Mesorhizobium alhagi CCNWXJ12-2]
MFSIVGSLLDGSLRALGNPSSLANPFNTTARYPGRERFTLAHELGHYVLHRRPLTASDYANGASPRSGLRMLALQSNKWQESDRERQEQADTFASFLLMPIDDYRKHMRATSVTA